MTNIQHISEIVLYFPFEDFNIQRDISRSQEALHQQDISAVSQASFRMLGRARRVALVTKKEMNVTADPMYKGKLQAACGELESGVSNFNFFSQDLFQFDKEND